MVQVSLILRFQVEDSVLIMDVKIIRIGKYMKIRADRVHLTV